MNKQKNVPELRFPEFNRDWDLKKLRSISSLSSGVTPLRSNSYYFENATIPWVKTTDLNNSEILKTEECISDIAIRETSAKKNPVGSLLIAMYGGFNQIGRTGLLKIEAATNQAITVVLPKTGIDSYFLLHFLNRNVSKWRTFAASSRKDPNITSKDVGDFLIVFPSITEQEKIASFLSAVDKKLTQLRRKKELLETYKRGLMQKIFSQQIRFKQDDGTAFPDWEEKNLGEFLKEYQERVLSNTDLPIYSSSREGLKPQKEYFADRELINEGEYGVVPHGFFVYRHMSDDLTFKFNINETGNQIAVSKEYPVFTTKKLNSRFLLHKLNYGEDFKKFAITQKRGGTRTRLYYKNLSAWKTFIPTLEEQQKIADCLTALDKKIEAVAQQIDYTEQFKKGLLQKMFV
jgi:type I restriction enzyme S subunit